MAESKNNPDNKVDNTNDTLDINELASLNEDISVEFLEQLQNKIAADNIQKNDGDLFEEVSRKDNANKPAAAFNSDIDDNFIKKYKAKLQKQHKASIEAEKEAREAERKAAAEKAATEKAAAEKAAAEKDVAEKGVAERESALQAQQEAELQKAITEQADLTIGVQPEVQPQQEQSIVQQNVPTSLNQPADNSIQSISGGNIMEHPISQEKIDYRNSLDYLDENVKYSKYVIYIDPENKNFIDNLTVKERKNLINRIIREQDAIDITKRRFGKIQTIIKHTIVAILTVLMAVPCFYWAVNATLETTINNYRQSQSAFEVLYREKGKLKKIK